MTSPSTILVTGAATAAAVAAGAPLLLIGAAALASYLAKVAASTFTSKDVSRALAAKLDVSGLREPYRGWVQRGISAKTRYMEALANTPRGPLQQRLGATAEDIDDVLAGLSRVARRAQGIDTYLSQPSTQTIPQRLADARARLDATSDAAILPERQKTVAALEEQDRVARRMRETYDRSVSRIESTVTSLDQLTAQLMEVLLTAEDASAIGEAANVEGLVAELHSVQAAVAELDPERSQLSEAEIAVQRSLDPHGFDSIGETTGAPAPESGTRGRPRREARGEAQ